MFSCQRMEESAYIRLVLLDQEIVARLKRTLSSRAATRALPHERRFVQTSAARTQQGEVCNVDNAARHARKVERLLRRREEDAIRAARATHVSEKCPPVAKTATG